MCQELLEIDPEHTDALCYRAELFIKRGMFEEAVKEYQTANNIEGTERVSSR